MNSDRHIAVYCRVSSKQQDAASQMPDLKRWVAAFAENKYVDWYTDHFTGRTMDRPAWTNLIQAVRTGKIERVVVWRLDRLGRTAKGLTALFDELPKDGLDLDTPAGRPLSLTQEQVEAIVSMNRLGRPKAVIARATGVSRPTVYRVIEQHG